MSLNNITGKTYGLIIPNKRTSKKVTQVAPVEKAFAEESDDEEAEFRTPNFDAKFETLKTSIRKTTKVNLEKALEEDASVFQYDEVYDKITREKEEKVLEKSRPSARTSKYVDKLMQASTVRKLEKELLNERKAQRELEADKEKYGDKEAFVTSAYKAKMAELRELVERRHQEESREEVMDVTKQDGLGGFYRYMYQQKTAPRPESSTTASQASKSQKTDTHKDAKTERSSTSHPCDDKDVKIEKRSLSRTESPPLRRHEESRHARDRRVPEEGHSSSSRHHHHHRANDNRHHRTIRRHSSSSSREGKYRSHRDGRERRKHRTTERGGGESTESSSRKNEVSKSVTPAPPALPPPPPGFIYAKPRVTTEEEVEAFRQRFLARKAAGLNKPKIVLSDDET